MHTFSDFTTVEGWAYHARMHSCLTDNVESILLLNVHVIFSAGR